jgi:hypothetical protein
LFQKNKKSIFDENADSFKKKNDWSRAKTTLTRRQNVVVVSILNRFCVIIFKW